MHKVPIALHELQAAALILHRMAFLFHLGNCTSKANLCNQGGTVSLFLSTLSCLILKLTNKHGITLISEYIPTHLNVDTIYGGEGWYQNSTFFLT